MCRTEMRLEANRRAGTERREDRRQPLDLFPAMDREINAEAGADEEPGKRNGAFVKRRKKRQQQLRLPRR